MKSFDVRKSSSNEKPLHRQHPIGTWKLRSRGTVPSNHLENSITVGWEQPPDNNDTVNQDQPKPHRSKNNQTTGSSQCRRQVSVTGDPDPNSDNPPFSVPTHEPSPGKNSRTASSGSGDKSWPTGEAQTEVAFELADNMLFRNSTLHSASLFPGSPNFYLELKLEPGKRYYYRAMATNPGGHDGRINQEAHHLGRRNPLVVRHRPDARRLAYLAVVRNLPQARTGTDWIYHAQLGWAMPKATTVQGLWLWFNDHHWMWTQSDAYPYLWKNVLGGLALPDRYQETANPSFTTTNRVRSARRVIRTPRPASAGCEQNEAVPGISSSRVGRFQNFLGPVGPNEEFVRRVGRLLRHTTHRVRKSFAG